VLVAVVFQHPRKHFLGIGLALQCEVGHPAEWLLPRGCVLGDLRVIAHRSPRAKSAAGRLSPMAILHPVSGRWRSLYNKAQRLPERRKMMQAWADYLDGLRANANVVPFRRVG
jgi:hypothetical protein